ncbi:2-amino-3-ketobutyrate coenzyme A ligase [Trypanosoma cruzi]|nr:hypothetical protein TcBrA4_0051040 [Trypanosoma cruzi]RNF14843.1 2-amino-3-ketobutyrate coenzyme A ligase [Trypanosoma cruzi]
MELLQNSSSAQKKLQENTRLFRTEMKKAGLTLSGHEECPIVPVMLYDARIAGEFASRMMSQGIYVIAFSYPVVPNGQARIRVQLSAAHSTEDVMRAVEAFKTIKKELNV